MSKWFVILIFTLSPLYADILYLKGNQTIDAPILKEDNKRVIVDLGFTLLQIPKTSIVRREKNSLKPKNPSLEKKYNLYKTKRLQEVSIKENVERFGEAVVKVSTPGGTGSGFIIHQDGYLITNFHVISGERRIAITLFKLRGKELEKIKYPFVEIVATNAFLDMALLKIIANPKKPEEKLPPFKIVYLGDIDEVVEGGPVFCIGNPLGMERSISDGIISAKRRQFNGRIYLQTTAPINPGNSGGPLFNSKGEVIGITNMKILFGENLGFAIPIHYLKDFLKNRDAFQFDKENPNSGVIYYAPPRKKKKAIRK